MRTYSPTVGLGSVANGYFSGVYYKVRGLLSNLKGRAATYLSEFLHNANIAQRLEECEQKAHEQDQRLSDLGSQVSKIAGEVALISQEWKRCAGPLRDTLSEIRVAFDNGEPLEPYADRLEDLMRQLPK